MAMMMMHHRAAVSAPSCNMTMEQLDGLLRESGYGSNQMMFSCYFKANPTGGQPLCAACNRMISEHNGAGRKQQRQNLLNGAQTSPIVRMLLGENTSQTPEEPQRDPRSLERDVRPGIDRTTVTPHKSTVIWAFILFLLGVCFIAILFFLPKGAAKIAGYTLIPWGVLAMTGALAVVLTLSFTTVEFDRNSKVVTVRRRCIAFICSESTWIVPFDEMPNPEIILTVSHSKNGGISITYDYIGFTCPDTTRDSKNCCGERRKFSFERIHPDGCCRVSCFCCMGGNPEDAERQRKEWAYYLKTIKGEANGVRSSTVGAISSTLFTEPQNPQPAALNQQQSPTFGQPQVYDPYGYQYGNSAPPIALGYPVQQNWPPQQQSRELVQSNSNEPYPLESSPQKPALPEGDWTFDATSGYYWSDATQMYYDVPSQNYYDPSCGKWYNPHTGEWC